MGDNLSWSSGTGYLIATTESGIGGGVTAHFQKVIVHRMSPPLSLILATGFGPITAINGITAVTAPGAGTAAMLTELTLTNSHGTTGTLVQIKNGTQMIHQVWLALSGGGAVLHWGRDNPLPFSANSACVVTCDASANVYGALVGYLQVGG